MAVINIDDVYILDETGAQVDKVTGLFTKDENTTSGEKAFAQLNIGTAGSNDNLLDNAYFVGGGSQLGDGIFPINQRGQTSYSGSENIFDRWKLQNAFANLAADSVYFGSTTQNEWGLMQQVPSCFRNLWGKTVTVSAILNNDELVQETYTIPSSGAFDMPAAGSGGVFVNLYSFDGSNIVFRIYTQYTASYHIKAAKLELGTVSTLANDVPPDFGEELRKCQRYLYIMGGAPYTMFGSGIAEATSYMMATIPFPVPMRTTPTLSVSGAFRIWGGVGYDFGVGGVNISSATQIATNCPYGGVFCSISAGNLTVGNIYYLQANNDINSKLIFSAEL